MCCDFIGDRPLSEDDLWQTADGLLHAALCLYTLEDFQATKEELASLQEEVLGIWKEDNQIQSKPSSLRLTFILRSKKGPERSSTLGVSFSALRDPMAHPIFSNTTTISQPRAPPGIPYPQAPMFYGMGSFLTPIPSYLTWGLSGTRGYNYDPIMGQSLMTGHTIRFPLITGNPTGTNPQTLIPMPPDLPPLEDVDFNDDDDDEGMTLECMFQYKQVMNCRAYPQIMIIPPKAVIKLSSMSYSGSVFSTSVVGSQMLPMGHG